MHHPTKQNLLIINQKKLKTTKIELNMVNPSGLPHPEGRLVYKQADEISGKINFVIKKSEVKI